LINAPEFQPGFFGILIKEANTGEEIFACNPDRLFMPASNMKLFTTTTAMALLDSNFTYKTDLYINGEIKNDTLFGDLIIKGSGDPTISGRFYNDNVLAVFQEWIGVLDSLKIKHITGKSSAMIISWTITDSDMAGPGMIWLIITPRNQRFDI
jgi:D-alanyl-D-alanine carboxypeptidase/D-alanyl-D-alanine-endopeptidase (penicillin-binding protein 4)